MIHNQETTADIIAEIRGRMEKLLNAIHSAPLCYPTDSMISQHEILYEFADRLEAAWKREHGNAAKLREALEFAEDELWAHGLFDASKRIASALAAPPRMGKWVNGRGTNMNTPTARSVVVCSGQAGTVTGKRRSTLSPSPTIIDSAPVAERKWKEARGNVI